MPRKKQTGTQVYQLKVTLKGIKPPIWRRVRVPADINLKKLHRVIQKVMGWEDCHLHQFIIGESCYGEPDPDDSFFDMEMENEQKFRLSQVAPEEKGKFFYEYDLGDGWIHQIVVEKILPGAEGGDFPVCLAGKRACPPEDVGGPWGYASFLEAVQDPAHEDHEDMLEWAGEDFDPETFSPEAVNFALKAIFR